VLSTLIEQTSNISKASVTTADRDDKAMPIKVSASVLGEFRKFNSLTMDEFTCKNWDPETNKGDSKSQPSAKSAFSRTREPRLSE